MVSSPKLEVIAQVVEENEEVSEVTDQPRQHLRLTLVQQRNNPRKSCTRNHPKTGKEEAKEAEDSGNGNYKLLSKFGFDAALLSDIRSWSNWSKLEQASIAEVLKEITVDLAIATVQSQKPCVPKSSITRGPGVGQTTTL